MIVMGGDYEHTQRLGSATGAFEIVYQPRTPREFFGVVLARGKFEASEFSLANHIIYHGQGDDWLTAVPVFPSRAFRHSHVMVRRDSPLRDFSQLAGCRIGVLDYSQTAAVWIRGLLKDEYGVDWRNVSWVSSGPQRFPTPPSVTMRATDTDLEDLLVASEIDALLMWSLRDDQLPVAERRLRPLIGDAQQAERRYLERTGIFPIMHTVVMRKEVSARLPGAGRAIFDAYAAAKRHALERRLGATFAPWSDRSWTDAMTLFGGDSHPYGLTEGNVRQVELLAGYLVDQGFIRKAPGIGQLFAPGSTDWRG